MTRTDLFNKALAIFGQLRVASDTENSPEAGHLRNEWDNVRRAVLRRFNWNFAETSATLTAVEDAAAFGYTYAYQLPEDYLMCLKFNCVPAANQATRFKVASGLIYSNDSTATLEYTRDEEDCTKWDDEFCNAFSYFLAAAVAPSITRDANLGLKLLQTAQGFLGEAKDSDVHESKPEVKRGLQWSGYQAARGGLGGFRLETILIHDLESSMD